MDRHDIIQIAEKLEIVRSGSPGADDAIHKALELRGPLQPYTTDETAAKTLIPPGYDASVMTVMGKHMGSCWRAARPAESAKAATPQLALCAAIMRAWAARLQ